LPKPARTQPTRTRPNPKTATSIALVLIGAWKLVEALVLFALGLGLLRYLHRDISAPILHWIHLLRMDPDNKYLHKFLTRVLAISPKQIREFSLGSFIYAGLRLIEGVGLVLRKRWAEYLVVIITAVFIPLEIYELIHRFTPIRLGVLLLNVIIVLYLARNLRRHR
jgi:uncharacterized membrane protein (DUF2068 family)